MEGSSLKRIYLVEDDYDLNSLIGDYLRKFGYEVICVQDFLNIEAEFEKAAPQLILLDINLPYYDGFYLCKAIRKKSKVPIIIISARNSDMDQVMGIETGADDYIIKPFSFQVLLAKIQSVERRLYGEYSVKDEGLLKLKDLTLNEENLKLTYNNCEIELTKNEYKLMKRFIEKKDKLVIREELLQLLWDDTQFVNDSSLTVNITRLKSKLEQIGIFDVIRTKRGIGYILDSAGIGGLE